MEEEETREVSVCMAAYNGEKYIAKQLFTVMAQTYTPAQVIICDDASMDHTRQVVADFIKKYNLSHSWKLVRISRNMGYPEVYYHVMNMCDGEFVFPAQQDDFWDVHKIEKMMKVFEGDPYSRAVCCDYNLMDESGQEIHPFLTANVRRKQKGSVTDVGVEEVFGKTEWPEAALAYDNAWWKKRYASWAAKNDSKKDDMPHDFLISAWAAEEGGFRRVDEELVCMMRHDGNAGEDERLSGRMIKRERRLREASDYCRTLHTLADGRVMETERGKEALMRSLDAADRHLNSLRPGK